MSVVTPTHKRRAAGDPSLGRLPIMNPPGIDAACVDAVGRFHAYVRFESRDPEANRDRYYDLLWQPTLFGEGALVRT